MINGTFACFWFTTDMFSEANLRQKSVERFRKRLMRSHTKSDWYYIKTLQFKLMLKLEKKRSLVCFNDSLVSLWPLLSSLLPLSSASCCSCWSSELKATGCCNPSNTMQNKDLHRRQREDLKMGTVSGEGIPNVLTFSLSNVCICAEKCI